MPWLTNSDGINSLWVVAGIICKLRTFLDKLQQLRLELRQLSLFELQQIVIWVAAIAFFATIVTIEGDGDNIVNGKNCGHIMVLRQKQPKDENSPRTKTATGHNFLPLALLKYIYWIWLKFSSTKYQETNSSESETIQRSLCASGANGKSRVCVYM